MSHDHLGNREIFVHDNLILVFIVEKTIPEHNIFNSIHGKTFLDLRGPYRFHIELRGPK